MTARSHNFATGDGMGLKAPGLLIFLLSLVLTVTVLIAHFFGGDVPFLKETSHHFYALLIAQALLIASCITRGL